VHCIIPLHPIQNPTVECRVHTIKHQCCKPDSVPTFQGAQNILGSAFELRVFEDVSVATVGMRRDGWGDDGPGPAAKCIY
jgi:hypothetical protein